MLDPRICPGQQSKTQWGGCILFACSRVWNTQAKYVLQVYETQRSEVRPPVHIITGSGTALPCYAKNTVPQLPGLLLVKLKTLVVCVRTR